MSETEENAESIIARCNKQLDVAPNDVTALIRRGLAHASMGDHRKAIVNFNLAIKHDPRSVDALHNRGNAWVSLGKLRKGIADLTKAIRLDPNSAVSYTSRGVAWSRKGRYANALADYERALELDPAPLDRPAGLAELLAICPDSRYRNRARAVELITEVCERTSYANVDYLRCLAAAHAEQGEFETAIEYEKMAIDLVSEPDVKEVIGNCIQWYAAGVPCRMVPPSWRQR